jgi:hypothetical protein
MSRTTTTVEIARAAIGVGHAVRVFRGSANPALDVVLAVRQVAQAVLVGRTGSGDAHTLSAVVDTLHGVTMVPLAADPRRRRFAVGQLWISAGLAIAEVAAVGPGRDGAGRRRSVGGRR